MDNNIENQNSMISIPPADLIPDPDKDIKALAQQVIEEKDFEQSKKLVDLFNWNVSKKNVLRILKLNGLLDKISDQMWERFEKRPDEISNKDLLDYMQAVQTSLEKSTKSLAQVDDIPQIQLQQNTQVNINVLDNFDRDARERIANAIQQILKSGAATEPSNSNDVVETQIDATMQEEQTTPQSDMIIEVQADASKNKGD